MNTLEQRTRTIGRVAVEVTRVLDDDPDSSWLGEWSNYREPANVNQKLVHQASGFVLDHHGIWRDERGRIQAAPEEDKYRSTREYQYTWHDNGHKKLAYALADHKRLNDLNNGDWCFVAIKATVYLAGKDIGDHAIWGFESDSGEDFFRQEEREIAREAVTNARGWLERNFKGRAP